MTLLMLLRGLQYFAVDFSHRVSSKHSDAQVILSEFKLRLVVSICVRVFEIHSFIRRRIKRFVKERRGERGKDVNLAVEQRERETGSGLSRFRVEKVHIRVSRMCPFPVRVQEKKE